MSRKPTEIIINNAPPTLQDIEAMAVEAFDTIPEELRVQTGDVVFRIEDFPDEETCREMDLDSPFELLGLYHGIPFGEKGTLTVVQQPDMIFLYRRPILDYWCETGEDLQEIVRHVLIHEIGHHFGFSDEDMERIEAEEDPDPPGSVPDQKEA